MKIYKTDVASCICMCGCLFGLLWMIGCSSGETMPATQGSNAVPTQVSKDTYEDEFVKTIHVTPPGSSANEYWITEDKATGARVLTQRHMIYASSATALSSCPLPPLPQALEKAKP